MELSNETKWGIFWIVVAIAAAIWGFSENLSVAKWLGSIGIVVTGFVTYKLYKYDEKIHNEKLHEREKESRIKREIEEETRKKRMSSEVKESRMKSANELKSEIERKEKEKEKREELRREKADSRRNSGDHSIKSNHNFSMENQTDLSWWSFLGNVDEPKNNSDYERFYRIKRTEMKKNGEDISKLNAMYEKYKYKF